MKQTVNQRIAAALSEHGPLTSAELSEHIGVTHDHVCVQISKMRRASLPGAPVISSWVRSIGSGGAAKAVWALPKAGAPRKDAKRPKREPRAISAKRWRDKNHALVLLKDRAKDGVPLWLAGLAPVGSTMMPRSNGRAAA